MKIVGVDLGKEGAVAHLDTADDSLTVFDMPIDTSGRIDSHELFQRWLDWEPDLAVIEGVWRPLSLVRQAGAVEAICGVLQIECKAVAVVNWKVAMTGVNTNNKELSIQRCKQIRPDAQLRRNARCRTDSADRAEAVLLALYARDHLTPTPTPTR